MRFHTVRLATGPWLNYRTLLLWGDQDAFFSRAHQDRIAAGLPDAALKVSEETGHCPNRERPERVAADVAEFVQVRA